MPDNTLTTTTPDGASTTRPVPPSWATVAPLLARWQMALLPQADGSWDVQPGYARIGPHRDGGRSSWWRLAVNVPFAGLPQAILDVAARCAADAETKEEPPHA